MKLIRILTGDWLHQIIFGSGQLELNVFCPRHQVTISITGDQEAQAMLNGTTEESKKDSMEFQKLIQ